MPRREGLQCVCKSAAAEPNSKNNRSNPSLLLRLPRKEEDRPRTIMVDAGKTMRQSVQKTFPRYGAGVVDAVLLTHDHADAMLGLDDLRELQEKHEVVGEDGKSNWRAKKDLPIFGFKQTLDRCEAVFPYLFPFSKLRPGGSQSVGSAAELDAILRVCPIHSGRDVGGSGACVSRRG
eukprot:CAMPEP_0114545620 /NCGR_PEP_ID=MMETSP0114-20121206/3505_1 /TAXON_ID=31324 /ORGANISM="Goniomonas sp, Strain m" /LENGTH=176 /DNA_ID=CAMNT_0001730075 /DNA_START=8 /DNA_END=534 /DNA_ORIENTATION=+